MADVHEEMNIDRCLEEITERMETIEVELKEQESKYREEIKELEKSYRDEITRINAAH